MGYYGRFSMGWHLTILFKTFEFDRFLVISRRMMAKILRIGMKFETRLWTTADHSLKPSWNIAKARR